MARYKIFMFDDEPLVIWEVIESLLESILPQAILDQARTAHGNQSFEKIINASGVVHFETDLLNAIRHLREQAGDYHMFVLDLQVKPEPAIESIKLAGGNVWAENVDWDSMMHQHKARLGGCLAEVVVAQGGHLGRFCWFLTSASDKERKAFVENYESFWRCKKGDRLIDKGDSHQRQRLQDEMKRGEFIRWSRENAGWLDILPGADDKRTLYEVWNSLEGENPDPEVQHNRMNACRAVYESMLMKLSETSGAMAGVGFNNRDVERLSECIRKGAIHGVNFTGKKIRSEFDVVKILEQFLVDDPREDGELIQALCKLDEQAIAKLDCEGMVSSALSAFRKELGSPETRVCLRRALVMVLFKECEPLVRFDGVHGLVGEALFALTSSASHRTTCWPVEVQEFCYYSVKLLASRYAELQGRVPAAVGETGKKNTKFPLLPWE